MIQYKYKIIKCGYIIKYVKIYTLNTLKVEYVCTTDGRKITSILTGLVRLGGKAATKHVGPGFDGSELATR